MEASLKVTGSVADWPTATERVEGMRMNPPSVQIAFTLVDP